jgi:phenylacetate-CoA ligase
LYFDRINNLDTLELWVEVDERFFGDQIRELQAIAKKLQHNLESRLGISITVKLVEPKSIARSEGKATRVVDKRKLI